MTIRRGIPGKLPTGLEGGGDLVLIGLGLR
jgi:hypothetical protein